MKNLFVPVNVFLVIFVLGLSAAGLVYRWSEKQVEVDLAAAHYEPPPKPLNQLITERQLAKYRQPASPVRHVETLPQAEPKAVDETEDSVAHVDDDPVREPCLDPAVCSATGYRYADPDPCEGHREMPDFTTPAKQELCRMHQIKSVDCAAFLKDAWTTGNESVDPSFALPDGCLP